LEAQYSTTTGRMAYPPAMLLTLWIYGYMKGINTSRELEQATRENMVFLYISAGHHPDHRTLSQFRKRNGEAFQKAASKFLQMLVVAGQVEIKTLVIDGTRIEWEKRVTAEMAREYVRVIEKYLKAMSEQTDRVEAEGNHRVQSGLIHPTRAAHIEKRLADKKGIQQMREMVAKIEAENAQRLAGEQASHED
ncbi:MAG: transposase, partial [Gammaproteobacteria bacterium]|nr:transposase [Gammaproteobacteria bacterium]